LLFLKLCKLHRLCNVVGDKERYRCSFPNPLAMFVQLRVGQEFGTQMIASPLTAVQACHPERPGVINDDTPACTADSLRVIFP
jgi:hypothetical protein